MLFTGDSSRLRPNEFRYYIRKELKFERSKKKIKNIKNYTPKHLLSDPIYCPQKKQLNIFVFFKKTKPKTRKR